jgi:hypothetical protein
MLSKFTGQCRKCGGQIAKGESIIWTPGRGAVHPGCSDAADVEKEGQPPHTTNLDRAIIAARFYIGAAPLAFGPLYFLDTHDHALMYAVYVPMLLSLIVGLAPAGFRIRVKWSSRPAMKCDVYLTWVMLGAGMSFVAACLVTLLGR